MKPIFRQLEGGKALWLRTAFVAVIVVLFIVVGWSSFTSSQPRTPRNQAFGGCNGPLGGVGR